MFALYFSLRFGVSAQGEGQGSALCEVAHNAVALNGAAVGSFYHIYFHIYRVVGYGNFLAGNVKSVLVGAVDGAGGFAGIVGGKIEIELQRESAYTDFAGPLSCNLG